MGKRLGGLDRPGTYNEIEMGGIVGKLLAWIQRQSMRRWGVMKKEWEPVRMMTRRSSWEDTGKLGETHETKSLEFLVLLNELKAFVYSWLRE